MYHRRCQCRRRWCRGPGRWRHRFWCVILSDCGPVRALVSDCRALAWLQMYTAPVRTARVCTQHSWTRFRLVDGVLLHADALGYQNLEGASGAGPGEYVAESMIGTRGPRRSLAERNDFEIVVRGDRGFRRVLLCCMCASCALLFPLCEPVFPPELSEAWMFCLPSMHAYALRREATPNAPIACAWYQSTFRRGRSGRGGGTSFRSLRMCGEGSGTRPRRIRTMSSRRSSTRRTARMRAMRTQTLTALRRRGLCSPCFCPV